METYTLEKQIEIFGKYAKSFNMNDENIIMKYKHSFRVVDNAEFIAKSMELDDENIYLAKTIALLHDIARFPQWEKYGTYADNKSVDHGEYGIHLLFDEELIDLFDIDKKYYPVIKYAIANHNKLNINLTDLPEIEGFDTLLHTHIVRDADKLDVAETIITDKAIKITRAKDDGPGISPLILEDIYNNRTVDYSNIFFKADSVLGFMGQAYGLVTSAAKQRYAEKGYSAAIFEKFLDDLHPSDAEVISGIAEKISNDLKSYSQTTAKTSDLEEAG